jgi:dethiobiotin synthase
MHGLRARGAAPRYWKPIQTGIEQDDDTAEVRRLGGCQPAEMFEEGVRLERPVSPHLAARWAGVRIDVAEVTARIAGEPDAFWIVEGAGGVLVPVNESELMTSVMAALGLPVLIVSRSTLGTINHTLLTIEALRHRSLQVAGVLMVGPLDADNRAAIETYGRVPVVGEMPPFAPLEPEQLSAWALAGLDLHGT